MSTVQPHRTKRPATADLAPAYARHPGAAAASRPLIGLYPGVRDEAAVLRAVRLRLQPAARLHRPAVVRPCGLLRLRGLRHAAGSSRRRAGRRSWASSPAWPYRRFLGLVFGLVAIRRQGIYFAMITLALAQMVFFVCLQAPFTGGEDGLQGVPRGKLFGADSARLGHDHVLRGAGDLRGLLPGHRAHRALRRSARCSR